jgi:esterase
VSPRAEGAGVELAYEESGGGPAVVFVHGMAGEASSWHETIEALGGEARAVAYDRRGYGASGAPEPYEGTTVQEQTEDAAHLIEALGAGPALICGHSFGGAISLDLALRHPELVRGLVVLEPALLWLSPLGSEYAAELREAIREGAEAGGPVGAVDSMLRLLGGDELFDQMGPERLAAARDSALVAAADLMASYGWQLTRGELRSIEIPTRVVSGTRSAPAWQQAAAAVAELMPNAELRHADATHMMPFQDPGAIATAVRELR